MSTCAACNTLFQLIMLSASVAAAETTVIRNNVLIVLDVLKAVVQSI